MVQVFNRLEGPLCEFEFKIGRVIFGHVVVVVMHLVGPEAPCLIFTSLLLEVVAKLHIDFLAQIVEHATELSQSHRLA